MNSERESNRSLPLVPVVEDPDPLDVEDLLVRSSAKAKVLPDGRLVPVEQAPHVEGGINLLKEREWGSLAEILGISNPAREAVPEVVFSSSAMQAIREISESHPDTEVGGILLGVRRDRKLLVMVATGPGNGARMSWAQFSPDLRFARAQHEYFLSRFGFQYLGEWHKHPDGMPAPSGTDARQASRIIIDEKMVDGFLTVIAARPSAALHEPVGVQAFFLAAPEGQYCPLAFKVVRKEVPQSMPAPISRAFVDADLLQTLTTGGVEEISLTGRFDDRSGSVLFSPRTNAPPLTGTAEWSWGKRLTARIFKATAEAEIEFGNEDLVIILDGAGNARGWQYRGQGPAEVPVRLYRPTDDVFRRNGGLAASTVMPEKRVILIGAGSVGSMAALEFARAGVGRLTLIDPDTLEPENVCRHACNLDDLGRNKVDALAERIQAIHPHAHVEPLVEDVLTDPARLETVIDGADLVFISTDTDASRSLTNALCWRKGIPAVYVSLMERADRGFCQVVIPGKTACRWCFRGERPDVPRGEFAYTGVTAPRDIFIQPGLSTDIGLVTFLGVRMALDALMPSSGHPIELMYWQNRDGSDGRPALSYVEALPRKDDCPVCAPKNPAQSPENKVRKLQSCTESPSLTDLEVEEAPPVTQEEQQVFTEPGGSR